MGKESKEIIESCRIKISAIDKVNLALAKEREQLSVAISRAKRDLLIPDRDFSREKVVFDNAKKNGVSNSGLPVSFATALQKLILEDSLSRQEEDRFKKQRWCTKIGARGGWRWSVWAGGYADFLLTGTLSRVVDQNHPGFDCTFAKTLDITADTQDIIVVATPIRTSIKILQQIYDLKLKKPMIFDVSSVKTPVYQALMKLKQQGAQVTSLHPCLALQLSFCLASTSSEPVWAWICQTSSSMSYFRRPH